MFRCIRCIYLKIIVHFKKGRPSLVIKFRHFRNFFSFLLRWFKIFIIFFYIFFFLKHLIYCYHLLLALLLLLSSLKCSGVGWGRQQPFSPSPYHHLLLIHHSVHHTFAILQEFCSNDYICWAFWCFWFLHFWFGVHIHFCVCICI